MKSLNDIIKTMIDYRNKPKEEPLSKAESLLCLVSYFEQLKYLRKEVK